MNSAQKKIIQRRGRIIKEALAQSKNTQYSPEEVIARTITAKLRDRTR
jgi:hypothetical protein